MGKILLIVAKIVNQKHQNEAKLKKLDLIYMKKKYGSMNRKRGE